mgnify:CR=1 FL=1
MNNIAIIVGNITNHAGTERAVTNLANLLVKTNKYNISIISMYSKNGEKCFFDLSSSVNIFHLNLSNKNKLIRIFGYLLFLINVNRIKNEKEIDCLIGTTHAINSLIVLLESSIKKIGCEHMSYDACPKVSAFLRKQLYKKLNAVVVLTKADADKYSFIKKEKLYVIPNSASFNCDLPSSLDNKRMITVGRLTNQKGYDILIKLAKKIKEKCPDWSIDIFGDGCDKEMLLQLIDDEHVHGYVNILAPTSNIKNELLNSSLYLMSSRYEGLPMVLIEAQLCGLPIISFDCPEGPAEVINDGEDGYLINVGDYDDYVRKVIKICKDDDLRKSFGRKATENSERFSTLNISKKWIGLLDVIL